MSEEVMITIGRNLVFVLFALIVLGLIMVIVGMMVLAIRDLLDWWQHG